METLIKSKEISAAGKEKNLASREEQVPQRQQRPASVGDIPYTPRVLSVNAIQDCQDGTHQRFCVSIAAVLDNGTIVFDLPYPFPQNMSFEIKSMEKETA